MRRGAIVLVAALALCVGAAEAVLVDFDDVAAGTVVNNTYAGQGVTFIGLAGGDVTTLTNSGESPVSDPNMVTAGESRHEFFRLDFAPEIVALSLYGCDYGGTPGSDSEVVTLAAYDGGGGLLGSVTDTVVRDGFGNDIVFLSLVGIGGTAYAEVTWTNDLGFFGIDNVEFTPGGEPDIPEPTTLVMLALAGAGLALRKRLVS